MASKRDRETDRERERERELPLAFFLPFRRWNITLFLSIREVSSMRASDLIWFMSAELRSAIFVVPSLSGRILKFCYINVDIMKSQICVWWGGGRVKGDSNILSFIVLVIGN